MDERERAQTEQPLEGSDGRGEARHSATRRGLIAGVAALVAAGLAKLAGPERAQAASQTVTTENIALGSFTTTVRANAGFMPSDLLGTGVLKADASPAGSTNVDGLQGIGAGFFSGVAGFGGPNGGNGIFGLPGSDAGNGVVGGQRGAADTAPSTAAGVRGVGGNQPGVRGHSTDDVGVRGRSVNSSGGRG